MASGDVLVGEPLVLDGHVRWAVDVAGMIIRFTWSSDEPEDLRGDAVFDLTSPLERGRARDAAIVWAAQHPEVMQQLRAQAAKQRGRDLE